MVEECEVEINFETHGLMEILGPEGDTKKIWSRGNEDEVADAQRSFDYFKGKGYSAFYAKKDGSTGRRMDAFDKEAEAMILVPQIAGG